MAWIEDRCLRTVGPRTIVIKGTSVSAIAAAVTTDMVKVNPKKIRKVRARRKIAARFGAIQVRGALEELIEDERTRLMKARSVLGCVALAMEGDEQNSELDFIDIIELARNLINESINRLDSVNLRPLLDGSAGKGR